MSANGRLRRGSLQRTRRRKSTAVLNDRPVSSGARDSRRQRNRLALPAPSVTKPDTVTRLPVPRRYGPAGVLPVVRQPLRKERAADCDDRELTRCLPDREGNRQAGLEPSGPSGVWRRSWKEPRASGSATSTTPADRSRRRMPASPPIPAACAPTRRTARRRPPRSPSPPARRAGGSRRPRSAASNSSPSARRQRPAAVAVPPFEERHRRSPWPLRRRCCRKRPAALSFQLACWGVAKR